MRDETYNGWSNQETWAANLHLDNNPGDYEHWSQRASESLEAWDPEGYGTPAGYLAQEMKEAYEEMRQTVIDGEPSTNEARMMVSDVGSFWRVDWHEIAEHWISDAIANAEYEANNG